MNPEIDLNETCREWRRLAEVEGEAICRRDWQLVFDCQSALRQLQPKLLRCSQVASNPRPHAAGANRNFRAAVMELIELERRNLELINTLRESATQQKQQLEQTHQNLRRIQRSYVSAREGVLNSLS